MKHYVLFVVVFLLGVLPIALQAEDYTYATNSDNTITIISYTGSGGDVTIPDMIEGLPVTDFGIVFQYNNTITSVTIPNSVTTIGDYAFASCTSLTDVKIPNSVTTIGSYAFGDCSSLTDVKLPNSITTIGSGVFYYCTSLTDVKLPNRVTSVGDSAFANCTSLTDVKLPNSVTSVGDSAFANCTGLTDVKLPQSVTTIGSRAFSWCTSLTDITIPNSVTSIGDWAFIGCTSLTAITVNAENFFYSSVDGVLLNKSQAMLILCPEGKAGSYTIPDGVTSIGYRAFSGCTSLTNITIGSGVTTIGRGAFSWCTSLTDITIPNSVTSIGDWAFFGCTSLTDITIPDRVISIGQEAFYGCTSMTNATIGNSVTSIGGWAFVGCTSLTEITIPGSVTNIGHYAFANCTGLTDIKLPQSITSIGFRAFSGCTGLTSIIVPNNVTSIEHYTFYGCTGLTDITIPGSVTNIGYSAFSGCTSLTAITVNAENFFYSSVDGVLLNKSPAMLILCPEGKAGSYTIPDGVTSIGYSAFSGCTSLTDVKIPNSVTTIGSRAFAWCTDLTNITIPDRVISIGDEAFAWCTSLTEVYFEGNAPDVGSIAFGYDNNTTIYRMADAAGWPPVPDLWAGCPTQLWYRNPVSPAIIAHPQNQTGYFGETVSFSAFASGGFLRYQWQFNGTDLTDSGTIFGAATANLTITSLQANNAGNYSVVVTNPAGSVTSSVAVLTVTTPPSLDDVMDSSGLTWTTGGDVSWFGQTATTHDGVDAAQSGHITDSQESWMQTTVTGPGTLTYWWKVSSEGGWDYLTFYIDDVAQIGAISGEVDWQQKSYTLTSGSHTLKWVYYKDGSLSSGTDAGWVDQVSFMTDMTADGGVAGLPDSWKLQYFGNSTDADQNAVCANGINTVRECYIAGLNPNDPQSKLRVSAPSGGKVLRWNAVSGRVYSVYWTTNLMSGFQCLESNIPWTRGSFTNSTTVPQGFYKIEVRLE